METLTQIIAKVVGRQPAGTVNCAEIATAVERAGWVDCRGLNAQQLRDTANSAYHARNGGHTGHIPFGADVFD
jgi:hypothetical protein